MTVTVNDDDPVTVGVPDTTPADDNDNPAGNDPADTDHTYGDVPPAATSDWLYAVPVTPVDTDVVDTDNTADATANDTLLDAVRPPASVTPTDNVYVPAEFIANVPDNTPVDVLNVTPDGNVPDNDHKNGPAPPANVNDDEYAVLRTPGANDDDTIDNGSTTSSDNDRVCVRPSASVTRTTSGYVPADPATAVPDNTPAELNDTPSGNTDAVDHEYGVRPPDADNDCDNAVPVTRSVNTDDDTANGLAATEIERALSAVRPPASVTRTVNDTTDVTDWVGVPPIAPVDVFSVRPAGRLPDASDQTNGPAPPVEDKDAE